MIDLASSPTTSIFYKDVYAKTWPVWVDSIITDEKGRQALIFNESVFYPQGGGQRGDRGSLLIPSEIVGRSGLPRRLPIGDTRKKDGVIYHYLKDKIDTGVFQDEIVGRAQFESELDWDFRFTQMRLHSAAHLIHCFMERALGVSLENPNFSDLQEDRGINRYDRPTLLSNEQLSNAVQLLNDFTAAEHSIRIYPDTAPGKPDWARLWECEDWIIPCGGVHPASTREIGPIAADLSVRKQQTTITFRLAS